MRKNQREKILKREFPEKEVKELKTRIEKMEAKIAKEKVPEKKEAIIKEEIRAYLQELQKTPSFALPSSARDETEEIKEFSRGEQVGTLISLVFEKGLKEAVSVARALNNPAILDEFHDTLIDLYYNMLLEKGVLKK